MKSLTKTTRAFAFLLMFSLANLYFFTFKAAAQNKSRDIALAGDVNNYKIVNHLDYLQVGLYFGQKTTQTPPADNANNNNKAKLQAIIKADLNKDGTVNAADTSLISKNYGKKLNFSTKAPKGKTINFGGAKARLLGYVNTNNAAPFNVLPTAKSADLPMVFEIKNLKQQNLKDVYGLAFSVKVNTDSVLQFMPNFSNTFLAKSENENILTATKKTSANSWDVAIVRTNQEGVSGTGGQAFRASCIVTVDFGLPQNPGPAGLPQQQKIAFEVENLQLISSEGIIIPVEQPNIEVTIQAAE